MKSLSMIRSLLLVASLGLFSSAPSYAQEVKFGFVSLERILRDANMAKSAESKLVQEFGRREKALFDMEASIKSLAEKLEKESPTLSDSQRVSRQKQLTDQDRDFQRKRREFQEDFANRKSEELQQVLDRANKVIKQVAETDKYDVILQEAVYVHPKHDISEKVLKMLNASK